MDDLPLLRSVGESVDRVEGLVFRDFFAGEIEFFAADPIDGW